MNKVIVCVGDIHGCLEEFTELLNKIQYNKNTMRLVLLGDLMDRGPDPVGCVRKAQEMGVECIKGNHEEKHLRWNKNEKKRAETGKPNGMRPLAPAAIKANVSLTDKDITWMKNLPLKLHLRDEWWAVHGGCEPRNSFANQDPSQIIRCRYVDANGKAKQLNADWTQPEGTVYWAEHWKGPESIMYGHCVHSLTDVRIDSAVPNVKCIGIDTGCCFGGHLTACIMNDTFEYVQVKAKAKYDHWVGDE